MIRLLQSKLVRERADRSSLRTEYRQLNEEDCSDTFQGSIDVIRTGSSVVRADDWIRASMDLFTRQVPFSVEPHRQVSRNAVIRTLSIGFGDRVRSQANIPVLQKPSELGLCFA